MATWDDIPDEKPTTKASIGWDAIPDAPKERQPSPIDNMSGTQQFLAGIGYGMTNIPVGIGQLGVDLGASLGIVSPETQKKYQAYVDERKRLAAPLLRGNPEEPETVTRHAYEKGEWVPVTQRLGSAGQTGAFVGQALPEALMFKNFGVTGGMVRRPAVNALVGGGIGAIQPTATEESRGLNALIGVGGGLAGFGTTAGIQKGLNKLNNRIIPVPDAVVDKTIDQGIVKSIRPGVAGNRTFKQADDYTRKAREAVRAIIDNKDNLKLTDDAGYGVKGILPENLRQFSQAIDQTKRKVFKEYDDLVKQAGSQTKIKNTVELSDVVKELDKVTNNIALRDNAPDTVRYAMSKAKAYNNRKFYTLNEAQDAVQTLNRSLEAFYKNPTYNTASKAYVDSLIVNNMKKQMDDLIMKSTGQNYQSLRNMYGSLKSIENDVNRRMVVDARKNVKGLIDFSDVFSGSEVIRGVMSFSPASIAAGAGAKTIATLMKLKNDPNRMIKNMFSGVENMKKGTVEPAKEGVSMLGSRLGSSYLLRKTPDNEEEAD